MNRRNLNAMILAAMAAAWALGSCATVPESTGEPGQDSIVELVVQDLAVWLNLSEEEIEVKTVTPIEWPDSSLGCPFPGQAYLQVITPGYKIELAADESIYRYHTDASASFVLCSEDGQPLMPRISLTPGEIQDGEPWIPAD